MSMSNKIILYILWIIFIVALTVFGDYYGGIHGQKGDDEMKLLWEGKNPLCFHKRFEKDMFFGAWEQQGTVNNKHGLLSSSSTWLVFSV